MKKIFTSFLIIFSVFAFNNVKAGEFFDFENKYIRFGIGSSKSKIDYSFDGNAYYFDAKFKEDSTPTILVGIGTEYKNFDISTNFKYQYYKLNNNNKVSVATISFDGNYLFRNSTIFSPYIGAGLNVNSFSVELGNDTYDNAVVALAYRAGLLINIKDNIDIDLNIQQTTKSDCFEEDIYFIDLRDYGRLKGEYRDTSINLNLLFRF